MSAPRLLLSIVCPAFEEEEVLPAFHARLVAAVEPLLREFRLEIVYVDDGSSDGTLEVLRQLARQDGRVQYLSLSRNFGHQAALSAGLEHASGDLVISLDSDLQHPPELIPTLIERWRAGHDVVITVREDGPEVGWFKRTSSRAFYWLMARVSDTEIHPAAADFRLLSRRALDALLRLRETHRFLRGMVNWLGFPVAEVAFRVAPRAAGRSHYTLRRMLRLAADGMLSFSRLPLRLPLVIGPAFVLTGVVHALILAGLALAGMALSWLLHLLLMAVFIVGGCTLTCLGVIGEYLGRVYEQVKQRPMYLLKEASPPAAQQTRAA